MVDGVESTDTLRVCGVVDDVVSTVTHTGPHLELADGGLEGAQRGSQLLGDVGQTLGAGAYTRPLLSST
jgi:hypothetical protein